MTFPCSDYLYALEFCQSTDATYTIMFEDDIIIATGWLSKVRQSLSKINEGAVMNPSLRNWIYLRLFYTETALSWETHADYWYGHMTYIFLLTSFISASLLITLRFLIPRIQRHLYNPAIFVSERSHNPRLFGTRLHDRQILALPASRCGNNE